MRRADKQQHPGAVARVRGLWRRRMRPPAEGAEKVSVCAACPASEDLGVAASGGGACGWGG